MYGWGDLEQPEYRRQKAEAEAALTQLPDNDKLLMFDRHREVLLSMAENIATASKERPQELIAQLVGPPTSWSRA